ncbi:hypothetical protein K3165_12305 [Qipengyuania sp. 1XM1-15A]|uniref:hypothetical protein n=1 Tax=Qipengyuania xiamenensis TaxID=2867237 RepID=UPI001C889230|nr:hypothetical protein [Qipengyuania xiamenensis]MBX7533708.1 hypothetical protein [Qipengyuania xiamenensis]
MVAPLAVFCAYICACFVLAALHSRLLPDSFTAYCLDGRPWMAIAWPFLFVYDACDFAGWLILRANDGMKSIIDRLSRKRRKRVTQSYFSYGSALPDQRRKARRARQRPRGRYSRRTRSQRRSA